jgi:hypothetical protein
MPEFMNANCRNVCSKNVCPNELVLVFVSRNIHTYGVALSAVKLDVFSYFLYAARRFLI